MLDGWVEIYIVLEYSIWKVDGLIDWLRDDEKTDACTDICVAAPQVSSWIYK